MGVGCSIGYYRLGLVQMPFQIIAQALGIIAEALSFLIQRIVKNLFHSFLQIILYLLWLKFP